MDEAMKLVAEKLALQERLRQLNVKSIGRDRVLQRIEAIDAELSRLS